MPPAPPSEKRILVIEDEIELADLVAKLLEIRGYEVEIAYDGSDGLAKIQARGFDLVITDLMMPKVSGWHVMEALERSDAHRDIPVMVMSAGASRASPRLAGRPFIRKPFVSDELFAMIEALIGAPIR